MKESIVTFIVSPIFAVVLIPFVCLYLAAMYYWGIPKRKDE